MTQPAPRTILQLIETSGPGGAETVFLGLLRGLDPARWRRIAVLPSARADVPGSDWLAGQLAKLDVETVFLDERGSFDVRTFRSLMRLARQRRAAVVHGHLFGYAVRGALLSMFTGIPAIGTLHGFSDVAPGEVHLGLKFGIINRGLCRAVFVSDPLRRHFLEQYPLKPSLTTVIPNGLDISHFAGNDGAQFRAEYDIRPDEFVVGSVGNLNPMKAIDVLLEAARILRDTAALPYRFVIVGDLKGEQGRRLIQMRDDLGLAHMVTFTGFRDDVQHAMAAFDAYALTSRSEGFSISVIEAMAAGVPIVATRCGGPEQILEDGTTGLLVENGSPASVAQGLERLRQSALLGQRLAAQARIAVRERFSMEAHVAAYEDVYNRCLSKGRGKG